MLKSLIPLAAVAVLAGCATVPQPHLADAAAQASRNNATCMTTGTRILLEPGECANVAGRSFSKEELDRAGAPTTAEALGKLDPRLW